MREEERGGRMTKGRKNNIYGKGRNGIKARTFPRDF
jgi:hypothetical protein